MDLTNSIKSKAKDLGFHKIGISSPDKPLSNQSYFDNWLKDGKNGDMTWLKNGTDKRKNIQKYFSQVESIISVAINYYHGNSNQFAKQHNAKHKFSNYAWGGDYHILIKEKLNILLDYIQTELNQDVEGVICVDSAPLMEKQWAQRAGIGWQGKHTILINDEYGSWMFLGELLINIPLDYDSSFEKNLCGDCSICIDACPTDALSDYQLDASKCISYLTDEFKGEFTESQKSSLNGWVFGCDICQQACPWNKDKQNISTENYFAPRKSVRENSLQDWLEIDDKSFKTIFKGSPLKRLKFDRFRRNLIAIDN